MATKIKFASPWGAARYPHLSAPDTTGKYADGKWKTKLVLKADSPEAVAYMKTVDQAALDIHGKKGASLHKPYTVDEEANEAVFTFKTSYAPALFDPKGKSLNGKDVKIGAGSIIRCAGNLVGYEKGISAQLNQVQVKQLESFGECAFDEVEGSFSADDYADATTAPQSDFADDLDDSLDI